MGKLDKSRYRERNTRGYWCLQSYYVLLVFSSCLCSPGGPITSRDFVTLPRATVQFSFIFQPTILWVFLLWANL